jgi:phosphoglycolate phosphatase-like HAD superfamily hydrolase
MGVRILSEECGSFAFYSLGCMRTPSLVLTARENGFRLESAMKKTVAVVITDLDNTLFDWVNIWHASFKAMLDRLVLDAGIPEETLISDFKKIHEKYGTSEYAFSIEELPSLKTKYVGADLAKKFSGAIEDFRSAREANLRLYSGVLETLETLKDKGCLLVGYTDSISFYSKYRVRNLGLDRVLDYLYSPPDHPLPNDRTPQPIEIRRTILRELPLGEVKPNPKILRDIIDGVGASPSETIYVGNSLMKDVLMAQKAKVEDVYAEYGNKYPDEQYQLLRRVTHWTAEDVEREKQLKTEHANPSNILAGSFGELLQMFEFVPFENASPDRMSIAVDIWKKTVDVQQHFNDLELRIRNYAVTVLAAMLGLTAYGLKENLQITILGFRTSVAASLLFLAILPWSAFYLMDRHWYHRLLYGAVHHGQRIERRWQKLLPEITLTDSIGEHSPVRIWKFMLHSRHKMSLFYWAGIIVLLLSGTIVHLGSIARSGTATSTPSGTLPMMPGDSSHSTAPALQPAPQAPPLTKSTNSGKATSPARTNP